MKHKIIFEITENSYWPRGKDYKPLGAWDIDFPQGGTRCDKIIEFESDKISIDLFHEAEEELKKSMGDIPYHIWYWWWC